MSIQLVVITNFNPFTSNTASANRLRSLLQGLVTFNIAIKLLIFSGYQNKKEKREFSHSGEYYKIKYKYLDRFLSNTVWKKRYQHYIGKKISTKIVSKRIQKELEGFNGIVWPENDLNLWQIIDGLPQKKFRVFSEMSEFLDIHYHNKSTRLQKLKGDRKQRFFEHHFIHQLDGLALMTKTLVRHYQSFDKYPHLCHLPMTVDLQRFAVDHPRLPEFQQPYIAFVGVMNDAKDGVNILIEAFKKITDKYPNYKLYMVGPWQYDTPNQLKMIQDMDLQDKVFWMKEYPRDQIPAIISNAELLVLPRPDSKQAQGGFPTKLGEYLATGNPVCATTVGEIPDYLEDNKSVFFAEPDSVDSFAQAMDRALTDKDNARKVGQEGKKVAEKHFNKDIQAKILYDFLKSLQGNDR